METAKLALTKPYSGYLRTELPKEDEELTHVGPRSACGEYFRKYWHPVALSSRLDKGLPVALRILGEDLVLFRDRSRRIGLLHRHCTHRGASLEFGIVSERGIRCCYHGWLYDIDGTILETPGEPEESPMRRKICRRLSSQGIQGTDLRLFRPSRANSGVSNLRCLQHAKQSDASVLHSRALQLAASSG